MTHRLSPEQFPEHILDYVPEYVYRTVSEEHYQKSVQEGQHSSDERNNWRAQQGYSPDDETAVDSSGPIPREGTVGFREPSRAYGVAGRNRTLRCPTSEHPDWEVHPDVPEGDYIRSLSPIPMTGVTTVDKWTVDK